MTEIQVPFVDFSSQHEPLEGQIKQAMEKIVRAGNFILGQEVFAFEQAFAKACGVAHGVGVACGTDAIALGLQACGIGRGDEVILPANTFIATLIGVLRIGATPILADCDRNTALLDLEAASKVVTSRTEAILPVHLYGQMVSPNQLLDFATTHNLLIFEDAAQAHLAQREGYLAGSVGDAAAFSFYPSKNLGACGDGGMLVTQNDAVAQKARTYRNYGAARKYIHTELGTNSRLDTLQAAILGLKLPHLKGWNDSRYQAAKQYDEALAPLRDRGITPIQNQGGSGHIYHLYVIRVGASSPLSRDELQAKLSEQGIQTGIHYPVPCHLQPAYQFLGYQPGDFPHAEALAQEILSLPMYPGLSTTQVQIVVESLEGALKG